MGKMIKLKAADGHELDAYLAEPKGKPLGGIVVVQEIFGVSDHIKRVADQYAAEGYQAIAPAMFDRIEPGITLPYTEVQQGIAYMQQLKWPNTLADLEAAAEQVRSAGSASVVGFCWGGTVAHVAASELDFDAAVSYYGGGVAKMLDKQPHCPIMYHFGDQDGSIPLADIEKVQGAFPDEVVHVYKGAGHGFNCDERGSYSAPDARLAFGRSLAFLRERIS
jgi:carboxymethylenebutenolidase